MREHGDWLVTFVKFVKDFDKLDNEIERAGVFLVASFPDFDKREQKRGYRVRVEHFSVGDFFGKGANDRLRETVPVFIGIAHGV